MTARNWATPYWWVLRVKPEESLMKMVTSRSDRSRSRRSIRSAEVAVRRWRSLKNSRESRGRLFIEVRRDRIPARRPRQRPERTSGEARFIAVTLAPPGGHRILGGVTGAGFLFHRRFPMPSVLERLSVLTDEVSANFVEALDWAVRNGFKHVEVRMVDGANVSNLSDADVDRAKREIDKRGLKVSAIASPLFKCALDPSRPVDSGDLFGNKEEDLATHMAKLPRSIAIAKKLGTRSIRIFSFWRESDPKKYMDDIVAH